MTPPGVMTPLVIPGVPAAERRHSLVLQSPLAVTRNGLALLTQPSRKEAPWKHRNANSSR
jgi:hypothetical protein